MPPAGGIGTPYASNAGVRIYYRSEGEGTPLVLLHGFAGSSEQLVFTGWIDALRHHYRLLVMDARGHGKSDKPHEPEAYSMDLRVGDVTAVLDHSGFERAHFLGYSTGGWTGWGIAKFAPARVASLIIGGADADDPDPDHPSAWSERTLALLRSGREAFVAASRESAERELRASPNPGLLAAVLPKRIQLLAACDPEAMIALLRCEQKERLRLAEVLPRLSVPCLVIVGEADPAFPGAKAASALLPRGRFVSFPGLGHFEAALRLDLMVPPVLQFLAEVDRKKSAVRPETS